MNKRRKAPSKWSIVNALILFLALGTVSILGSKQFVKADFSTTSETKITADDAAVNDNLGYSVSISGNTVVAGAPFDNNYTGAAYVYVREGNTWVQQAKLTANNGVDGDLFGWAVSVSGDVIAIGAQRKNSYQGAVYVFERSSSIWSQKAELNGNENIRGGDAGALDNPCFGCSVSISGDTIVVGANNSNNAAGAAFIFVRSGSIWIQEAEILGHDTVAYDEYGAAVSVSGDTAVVVASGRPTGAAYVFVRSGLEWNEQGYLSAPGTVADGFGSVAIDANTVLVGDFNGFNTRGQVYIFASDGSTWNPQAMITPNDSALNDSFGCSVAISGDTALVGAFSQNGTGAAYVFVRSDATWKQQAKLTANDAVDHNEVGYSVSLSGDTAILGAPLQKDKAGAGYVFGDVNTTAASAHSTTPMITSSATELPQEHKNPGFNYSYIWLGVLALLGTAFFTILFITTKGHDYQDKNN